MKVFLVFIMLSNFFAIAAHGEIRESARELLMQGERPKAYELLINGLSSRNKKSKNKLIKKELSNLSNVFISEESQKFFQQAQTLFYSGDEGYVLKLKKAEKLEPHNLKVIFTKAWFLLVEKKCSKAKVELKKIKDLNIQYKGLSALDYHIKLCEGKPEAECGIVKYNTKEDLREKILKLISCRAKKESAQKLKRYCKLLKIDIIDLPEVGLWCSSEVDKLSVYKKQCEVFKKTERKRALFEVYPFVCSEEISSKVIKD